MHKVTATCALPLPTFHLTSHQSLLNKCFVCWRHDKTVLNRSSSWMLVCLFLFHQVVIKDQMLCNLLTRLQNIQFWLVQEVYGCILDIDDHYCEKGTVHTVGPPHCHPSCLHLDRMHPKRVVIVNHVLKFVVVFDDLWVFKLSQFLDSIHSELPLLCFSHTQEHTICRHQHHHIIWLFHSMNVE